jgi:RimJ/RimL family protein N-acetyltransferase
MAQTVLFRDFEERDVDFIYRCKNDEKLNRLTVGQYHPFTYEEAVNWVHGCMGEHKSFRFWAVCTNDDEKRIVGWISLSKIDSINKSACMHSVLIGDEKYRDGLTWIECVLFLYEYVFEVLDYNRIYGLCLEDQTASRSMAIAMFETIEGVARQSVYKNNKFNNVIYSSLLKEEYFQHKQNGEYKLKKIISRIIKTNTEFKKHPVG